MDCIEILRELVRFDTVNPPGNEKPAAVYLADILKPAGFTCDVQELGDNRANLVAFIGDGSGPELMFNGHLDVVPAGGEWKTRPFTMESGAGRLYGRGTSDMKGGIAAMCEAAMRTAARSKPLKGRLKLLFSADEECSNLGTLSYFDQYGPSQYAVIGEPTCLEIAVAHRGVSRDYIDVYSPPRHAALPSEGEDAVMKAVRAVRAVNGMNEELKKITHKVLPSPGIAVTMMQGYEKDNVVPGHVRLLLDFRILPGMDRGQAERFLRDGFDRAGLADYKITPHFYMPGGEVCPDDGFVQLCLEEKEKVLGSSLGPLPFDASCEQCFMAERGIKTVICGPGSITQAHTTDEFVEEQQVRTAVDLYQQIINRVLY